MVPDLLRQGAVLTKVKTPFSLIYIRAGSGTNITAGLKIGNHTQHSNWVEPCFVTDSMYY